jgi:hypothetical protein
MSMQPVMYDIFRWMIGFMIVSTLYLFAAHWLLRVFRKRRARKQEPAAAESQPQP